MVCSFEVLFEMGFYLSDGQKGRITTGKAKNWAIICLVYLLVVSRAITLAINIAIQYFVLGILQQTLFVALRTHYHHHWDPRKSSTLDNGGDWRSWRDVQSRCLGSDGSKAS